LFRRSRWLPKDLICKDQSRHTSRHTAGARYRLPRVGPFAPPRLPIAVTSLAQATAARGPREARRSRSPGQRQCRNRPLKANSPRNGCVPSPTGSRRSAVPFCAL